jgi:hypothetical protein
MTETKAIAKAPAATPAPPQLENLLIQGDLAELSEPQRVAYYLRVCESLALNPFTRPFEYLRLNGRLVLYAKKDCTDQLRSTRRISVEVLERTVKDGLAVVKARATAADGRSDESIGVVACGNAQGENLANALMKAETKAKRRVTLSICGLGFADESEVDDTPQDRPQLAKATKAGKPEVLAAIEGATTLEELEAVVPRVREHGLERDRDVTAAFAARETNLRGQTGAA